MVRDRRGSCCLVDGGAVMTRDDAYDLIDRFLRNECDDKVYAEFSEALELCFTDESLHQQLADSQKREAMLRVALERLVTERRAGLASLEGWDAAREALAATTDLKCVILCHAEPCRDDGRCQYAIDHGAEGLGHCPEGKCCMPRYSPKGLK